MLRLVVAALLAANLLFWAWHHTPLPQALGASSAEAGREPERLQRQIRPEAIQLLTPAANVRPAGNGSLRAGPSAAADGLTLVGGPAPNAGMLAQPTAPTLCLEAGPLDDNAVDAAARELAQAGVPAGGWVDMRRELPGRWAVYMGRYAEREILKRKAEELLRLGLTTTELKAPPDLAPGLALGEFAAQADAQARLDRLQARGVRTARVVQLPSPGVEHRLRIDRVEAAAAEKLAALSGEGAAARWQPCGP